VEYRNKFLESILTKTIHLNHKDWADRLPKALWAYQTMWRNTTGHTPYELVFGKQILLPIEFKIHTFHLVVELGLNLDEAQKERVMQLNELGEIRKDALQRTILVQNQRSKWHDKYIKKNHFQPRDWALLFDSKYKTFKGKLMTRWLGPYEVETIFYNGSVRIKIIDDSQNSFVVNGHRLKVYKKPLSRDDFI
jgi:hypothetical protein